LHVHVLVPGPVLVQVALASQPPFFVLQLLMGAQVIPLPAYPVLQVHVFVPGPVLRQVALASHPPFPVEHALIGAQEAPVPE
jgi:hypothetical protein